MERPSSGRHSCKRLKRQYERKRSGRTVFARSIEKGPEESTAAVLGGNELCVSLAPRLSLLSCLLDLLKAPRR